MKLLMLVFATLLVSSCHPLSMFRPKDPRGLIAISGPMPNAANIKVTIDAHGIPYIKAADIESAMYGLGFMHARDRLFQLDLLRHAALGRLSEIFGKKMLSFDRKYRLLSYRLNEQLQLVAAEEKKLLEAYVAGVNESLRHNNRSAEHFFLGIQFEQFTAEQALAIARLQSWQLASDLLNELYRLRLVRSSVSTDAKAELVGALDDQNSAIIRGHYAPILTKSFLIPPYLDANVQTRSTPMSLDFPENIAGASNAWAVRGHLMKDKYAVLMNDPHLPHAWPSNFYLASIEAADLQASGATLVGLPAVLIGSSPHVSWGVTASYVNTQDSVKLSLDKNDAKRYWVDGIKHDLQPWPQRFCTDKKGTCVEEMRYTSIFGPIIDSTYDAAIEKNDVFALMWTGFLVEEHASLVKSFVRLMAAKDVQDAATQVSKITLPGVNLILADTQGNVGYAYAGLIPKRDMTQNPYLPLDGAQSASKWAAQLSCEQKPHVINPAEGFIVTANQNINSRGAPEQYDYGKQGAPPYRALRIREKIEKLLASQKPISSKALSKIQLDSTSIEARELAPTLGRLCQEQWGNAQKTKANFAKKIANFNGKYTTTSLAALPFDLLLHHIIKAKLNRLMGEKYAALTQSSSINYTIANALVKEIRGQKTAIFNDEISWQEQVKAACEPAYRDLLAKAGKASWKWRWGRHHYLYRQSPIAKAPFIGNFFRDKRREVAGTYAAPLAEGGLPVRLGANLRFQATMSTPPQIHMVLDSGNIGSPGHQNALDQAKLWHKGKTIKMATSWEKAQENARLTFEIGR